jgi:cation diffusion facilitator family transporter
MSHDNRHGGRDGERITWVGAAANAGLVAFKFVAGFLGHSQALIADAVHSVSDFFTDAVVLLGLRFGRKAPDADHHFGHARIETLASTVVGVSLLAVAVLLGYQASQNIYSHKQANPNWLALIGAGVSILVKEVMYQYTMRVGRRIRSQAVIANAWHHRSDALSSLAVLAGIGGILINPDWYVLDAFAALLVSLLIAKVGLEILWQSLKEITDTAPEPEVMERIHQCILGIEGVEGDHDVKVRISGGLYHAHVHIEVDGSLNVTEGHRIAKNVQQCLIEEIEEMGEVIVHVDPAENAGEG